MVCVFLHSFPSFRRSFFYMVARFPFDHMILLGPSVFFFFFFFFFSFLFFFFFFFWQEEKSIAACEEETTMYLRYDFSGQAMLISK